MASDPDRGRAPLGSLVFLARSGLAENRAITALMILAVAAGVAFQISNTANLDGYTAEMTAQAVTDSYGEIRIAAVRGSRFSITSELRARLADPDIAAWVPLIILPGAVGVDGAFRNALVIAVDPDAPRKPFRVSSGAPLTGGDPTGVLAGTRLTERLGLAVGGAAELRVITGGGDGVFAATVRVRGTAQGTFVAPEAVIVDRVLVAAELPEPEPATLIAVYTRAGVDEDAVARRLSAALPSLTVRTWREDSTFAASAIASSSVLARLSRWMVAFAVIVPVWALLYIHVLHRRRAIALITALGLRRGEVFAVYMLQALLVGVVGIALGGIGGYVAIRWFESHPIFRMDMFEVSPVMSTEVFAWPMALVLAITLLAGVIPALRAARSDPATILRGRT